MRFIIDGCGVQPFEPAREARRGRGLPTGRSAGISRRSDQPLGSLPARRPDSAGFGSSSKFERAAVNLHPLSPRTGPEPRPDSPGDGPGGASPERRCAKDLPAGLKGTFVSRLVGVVRRRQTTWEQMALPVSVSLVMWKKGRRQELC